MLTWAKCSKNEAGLKIFAPLCDEKMCPFQKQTYSGSGIVFYYFFKFQRLLLWLNIFKCFHSIPVDSNRHSWMRFPVCLWLTYSILTAHLSELVWSSEVNQFTWVSQSNIIQFLLMEEFPIFTCVVKQRLDFWYSLEVNQFLYYRPLVLGFDFSYLSKFKCSFCKL